MAMLTHHANEASGQTGLNTHEQNEHGWKFKQRSLILWKGRGPFLHCGVSFWAGFACVWGLSFILRVEASAKKAPSEEGPDTQPNSRD